MLYNNMCIKIYKIGLDITVQSFCDMIGHLISDVTKSEPEPRW